MREADIFGAVPSLNESPSEKEGKSWRASHGSLAG